MEASRFLSVQDHPHSTSPSRRMPNPRCHVGNGSLGIAQQPIHHALRTICNRCPQDDTDSQGAIIEYYDVLHAWDYKWRGRRYQQQDHVDQTPSRRLSQHRELQESDLFLLRRNRSLPTVMPDGPQQHLKSVRLTFEQR